MDGPTMLAGVAACAALASAALTWAALRYARWRRLLDQPGRRRMHANATPRGGGIAIVLVMAAVAAFVLPWPIGAAFAAGLLLVAGIGWIDDHRPLSARVRLLVHLLAATLFVLALWPPGQWHWAGTVALCAVAIVGLAAAVNFWNFMDGSNGLVASQSLWFALVLAAVGASLGAWPQALCAAALAGACAGFLPFNAPRARIFLGDVGSGGVGFACAALWLLVFDLHAAHAWWLALVPAALLIDAGLTLLHRILLGRRWYTAHREHLYQWLVRSGSSHGAVLLLYLGWNLLVLLPAVLAVLAWPRQALPIAAAALLATLAAWVFGKRAVLRRVRHRP